jgi:hypothetical protein
LAGIRIGPRSAGEQRLQRVEGWDRQAPDQRVPSQGRLTATRL